MTADKAPKSLFSADGLAAIANVLLKAPNKMQQSSPGNKKATRSIDKARTQTKVGPRSFATLHAAATGEKQANQGKPEDGQTKAPKDPPERPESAVDPIFEIKDKASSQHFQPRKGKAEFAASRKPSYAPNRVTHKLPKPRKQESPRLESLSLDRVVFAKLPAEKAPPEQAHEDALEDLASPQVGKKNKKQMRTEAKVEKAARGVVAAEAKEKGKGKEAEFASRSHNESPSPRVKIDGWDMDPHSKPASDAGFGGGAAGRIGGMFEEDKPAPRRLDKNVSRKYCKAPSFLLGAPVDEDGKAGAERDWAGAQRHNKSGSRKSGSRHSGPASDGSKRRDADALEAILEDIPFSSPKKPVGWGDEEQQHLASKRASSHRSHRSRGMATPEPKEWGESAQGIPSKQGSILSGAHVSYKAPTVEDVPEDWTGWDQEPERQSNEVRSYRISGSHKGRLGALAEARAGRESLRQSYHSRKSEEKASSRQSRRSRSIEKVNEWFQGTVSRPEKATPQPREPHFQSQGSRQSHMSGYRIGWENGKVPSDASIGTGYNKRAEEEDVRTGEQAWGERQSWDKGASSESSARADLGVREPSAKRG
jgi:hypothetical protein